VSVLDVLKAEDLKAAQAARDAAALKASKSN
jgi:hypothetical protein